MYQKYWFKVESFLKRDISILNKPGPNFRNEDMLIICIKNVRSTPQTYDKIFLIVDNIKIPFNYDFLFNNADSDNHFSIKPKTIPERDKLFARFKFSEIKSKCGDEWFNNEVCLKLEIVDNIGESKISPFFSGSIDDIPKLP